MTSTCPVTQAASSPARNATAAATSSGQPNRRIGYDALTCSSRPSYNAVANRVLTTAGATALTRIAGASSSASWWVR